MYNFPSHYVVTLYFFSIADLRCNACSFPKYVTTKSSTTKVNFIGWQLCFHSPGFFSWGGVIHTALGFLLWRHVISVLLGGVRTFPLLTLYICIHCVLFLQDYIFLQILVVSLKSGSWCIHPCPYGCSGSNLLRHCKWFLDVTYEMALCKWSFMVVKSDVGVLTSHG